MDFSLIIPTLNEEDYLPRLLDSIKGQKFQPAEIIVADSHSKDRTREIARKRGCEIVPGGPPAIGRNNGARKAKSEILVFMDADSHIDIHIKDPLFFRNVLTKFQEEGLDVGTCFARNEPNNRVLGRMSTWASNFRKLVDLSAARTLKTVAGGSGWFIVIKKDVFDKLGGFDERLGHYEDTDLFERTVKAGYKFGLFPYAIYLSGRRFDKMNPTQFLKTGFYMLLYKIGRLIESKESNKYLASYGKNKGSLGGG